jgi:hypothetical protein
MTIPRSVLAIFLVLAAVLVTIALTVGATSSARANPTVVCQHPSFTTGPYVCLDNGG